MNAGMRLLPPCAAAILSCGLCLGLDPPGAGYAWQPPQLVPLKRGPRPAPGSISPAIECTCWNALRTLAKYWAFTLAMAPPAFAAPVRTPGSIARDGVSARLLRHATPQPATRKTQVRTNFLSIGALFVLVYLFSRLCNPPVRLLSPMTVPRVSAAAFPGAARHDGIAGRTLVLLSRAALDRGDLIIVRKFFD